MTVPESTHTCRAKNRWTKEDFVDALETNYRLRILRPSVRWPLVIFGTPIFLMSAYLVTTWLIAWDDRTPPFMGLGVTVAGLYFFLAHFFINRVLWGRQVKKRTYLEFEIEYNITSEHIEMKSSQGQSLSKWEIVVRVVDRGNGFLVYFIPEIMFWLPYRAFESSDCVAHFREYVTSKKIALISKPRRE